MQKNIRLIFDMKIERNMNLKKSKTFQKKFLVFLQIPMTLELFLWQKFCILNIPKIKLLE